MVTSGVCCRPFAIQRIQNDITVSVLIYRRILKKIRLQNKKMSPPPATKSIKKIKSSQLNFQSQNRRIAKFQYLSNVDHDFHLKLGEHVQCNKKVLSIFYLLEINRYTANITYRQSSELSPSTSRTFCHHAIPCRQKSGFLEKNKTGRACCKSASFNKYFPRRCLSEEGERW